MASRDPPTSFDKVADLETAEDANLHGVITNVSPMKKGGGLVHALMQSCAMVKNEFALLASHQLEERGLPIVRYG